MWRRLHKQEQYAGPYFLVFCLRASTYPSAVVDITLGLATSATPTPYGMMSCRIARLGRLHSAAGADANSWGSSRVGRLADPRASGPRRRTGRILGPAPSGWR